MSISTEPRFITFEGIDGCGKSTQVRLLMEQMNEHDISTILVREPGGTLISEKVREILLGRSQSSMSSRTEALLMASSRAQLTREVILPNLNEGKWVLADRYSDSTLAYQGGGRNLDLDWLIQLNAFATYGLEPDTTFVVDVLPEVGLRRNEGDKDRIEQEGIEFQNNVRKMYLNLSERFPERMVIIDGHVSPEHIHQSIWKELERRHYITS